ncbi:hypothetical protein [Lentzea albidocapillata]|uniref:Uncharacterized protein n=1 Tax=Lentzea albidocapillata TaxID=40571 RepID=A0A1W2FJ27_9PSEU|nr:hypothetical protein [Lentzea albidocapillata]SMD22009.1 hypothetical protein SAMN05660733_06548 [Lentzea albidocapillata]
MQQTQLQDRPRPHRVGARQLASSYCLVEDTPGHVDSTHKVYAQSNVTSTYAVSFGNEWAGGGLFQVTPA